MVRIIFLFLSSLILKQVIETYMVVLCNINIKLKVKRFSAWERVNLMQVVLKNHYLLY